MSLIIKVFLLIVMTPLIIVNGQEKKIKSSKKHKNNKYTAQKTFVNKFRNLNRKHGISHSTVNCAIQDKKGFMWFGTGGGLNRYDGYSITEYKTQSSSSNSIVGNAITSIIEDFQGNLWVATMNGLSLLNTKTGIFTNFSPVSNVSGIKKTNITKLFLSSDNVLWVGYSGGFSCFSIEEYYKNNKQIPKGILYFDLPNTNVSDFIEDQKNGNMYIGSYGAGILKVSMAIKKISDHYTKTNSNLKDNHVQSLIIDHNGFLTIGTQHSGVQIFNIDKQKFISKKQSGILSEFYGDKNISALCLDKYNRLWVGTKNSGLFIVDQQKNKIWNFKNEKGDLNSISNDKISDIYADQYDGVWISTIKGGINYYDLNSKQFHHIKNIPGKFNSLSDNNVISIYQDHKNQLWIGTMSGGLNRYHLDSDVFTGFNISKKFNSSVALALDKKGNIWSVPYAGPFINRISDLEKKPTITFFNTNTNGFSGPDSWAQLTIFCDSKGVLWFGSFDGGLGKIELDGKKFTHYKHEPNNPKSISNNIVLSISEDNSGNLWVGTYNGLNRFNKEKGTFQRFTPNDDAQNTSMNSIRTIYQSNDSIFWFGTGGGGLCKTKLKTDSIAEYSFFTENEGLPNNMIMGILPDKNSNLWLSTEKGISKFDTNKLTFRNYTIDDGLQGDEFNPRSWYKSSSGELYFGGTQGITHFFPDHIKDNTIPPTAIITDFRLFDKNITANDTVNGRVLINESIIYKDSVELFYNENDLSFEFSAIHYSIPERNNYSYKMEGYDKEWIFTNAQNRKATYTNLDLGKYTFLLKAANPDGLWQNIPTKIYILILPPWWQTWWAYTTYILLFSIILYMLQNRIRNNEKRKSLLKIKHIEFEKQQTINKNNQELDQMKIRLFSNISHEFKTPLTFILGSLEKLIDSKGLSSKYIENQMKLIHRNAMRLSRLTNQIIDLQRFDKKKIKLHVTKGNITEYLKNIYESYQYVAEKHNITYRFLIKNLSNTDKSICYFDTEKLEKIMHNLLSNAFKHAPDYSAIFVELTLHEQMSDIEVSIKDEGIGISEDKLPYIFDRFYSIQNTSVKSQNGVGIGLALTLELIELHYGTIWVKSQENQGSEFTFKIPVSKDKFKESEISIQQEEKIKKQSRTIFQYMYTKHEKVKPIPTTNDLPLILIVDDDPNIRFFVKQDIQELYNIIEAENGKQALEKVQKFNPDIIISDIMMPTMSGIELLHKLKTNEDTSHIPIIMLTALASEEAQLKGLEIGADDYIAKPFNLNLLKARINNLIQNRKKLQNYFSNTKLNIEPSKVTVTSVDKRFIENALQSVEKNIDNPTFGIDILSKELGISQAKLYRKTKAITNQTPAEFIRVIRLKRAAYLLVNEKITVSEVIHRIGISSRSYFTKCFKKQFGVSPSSYAINQKGANLNSQQKN